MIATSCKRYYAPPAVKVNNNYLVVEGVISAGGDSTIIKLSRTIPVSATNTLVHETGATITINDDQGAIYPLHEADSGRYTAGDVSLDTSRKFKLNITTADGKTYASDYVPVKITPPMDTLGYDITATGVNFYAGTHDPTGVTKYYRWDYTETYIYESNQETPYVFDDSYKLVSNKFRLRKPDQQDHICYITKDASSIVLRSTANLSQDIIPTIPITRVASASEKMYYRYSILVKQYALTPQAYNFWSQLRKNTEQIGTVFDPQPSEIQGNVHCTSSPGEAVIGFISAGTVSQKRIFIDRSILPWTDPGPATSCTDTTLAWDDGNIPPEIKSGVWIPLEQLHAGFNPLFRDSVYSVRVAYWDCSDCRYHDHASNVKPAFWK